MEKRTWPTTKTNVPRCTGQPAPAGLGTYTQITTTISMNAQGDVGFAAAIAGGPHDQVTLVHRADGSVIAIGSNDPAPGPAGTTFYGLDTPRLNDAGDFVFKAGLSSPGSSDPGWLRHTAAGLELVVRVGDPVPALPGVVYDWNLDRALIEDGGAVLLMSRGTPLPGGGSMLTRIDAGVHDLLLKSGDPVPGLPGVTIDRMGEEIDVNSSGQIALWGYFAGTPIRGVLMLDGGSVVPVSMEGDPSPLSDHVMTFGFSPHPNLNAQGQLAFLATYEQSSPVCCTSVEAIQIYESGGLTEVVRAGDPVPSLPGTTFYNFGLHRLADSGDLLFLALIQEGSLGPIEQGLFLHDQDEGTISVVARQGDPAPGIPGAVIAGFVNRSLELAADGRMAFAVSLDDDTHVVYRSVPVSVPMLGVSGRAALLALLAAQGFILRRRNHRS